MMGSWFNPFNNNMWKRSEYGSIGEMVKTIPVLILLGILLYGMFFIFFIVGFILNIPSKLPRIFKRGS